MEQIYEYLLNNCVGYDNRAKSYELMKMFDIKRKATKDRQFEYEFDNEIKLLKTIIRGKKC